MKGRRERGGKEKRGEKGKVKGEEVEGGIWPTQKISAWRMAPPMQSIKDFQLEFSYSCTKKYNLKFTVCITLAHITCSAEYNLVFSI